MKNMKVGLVEDEFFGTVKINSNAECSTNFEASDICVPELLLSPL